MCRDYEQKLNEANSSLTAAQQKIEQLEHDQLTLQNQLDSREAEDRAAPAAAQLATHTVHQTAGAEATYVAAEQAKREENEARKAAEAARVAEEEAKHTENKAREAAEAARVAEEQAKCKENETREAARMAEEEAKRKEHEAREASAQEAREVAAAARLVIREEAAAVAAVHEAAVREQQCKIEEAVAAAREADVAAARKVEEAERQAEETAAREANEAVARAAAIEVARKASNVLHNSPRTITTTPPITPVSTLKKHLNQPVAHRVNMLQEDAPVTTPTWDATKKPASAAAAAAARALALLEAPPALRIDKGSLNEYVSNNAQHLSPKKTKSVLVVYDTDESDDDDDAPSNQPGNTDSAEVTVVGGAICEPPPSPEQCGLPVGFSQPASVPGSPTLVGADSVVAVQLLEQQPPRSSGGSQLERQPSDEELAWLRAKAERVWVEHMMLLRETQFIAWVFGGHTRIALLREHFKRNAASPQCFNIGECWGGEAW